ncbi:MAG: site-specific DNA-methyltransferase [Planctomycetota bacterium]
MAHWSESANRLGQRRREVSSLEELTHIRSAAPSVWALLLPFDPCYRCSSPEDWTHRISDFIRGIHTGSTIALLMSPYDAAALLPKLEGECRFQLWVAVKLKQPVARAGHLPLHHAALLILTKYNASLRHTKTRIAYAYCPSCERTAKDYGGKKHTYHEYGTLMSDVWRDVSCEPTDFPKEVVFRLRDVFGLAPYKQVNVIDLRSALSCHPTVENADHPVEGSAVSTTLPQPMRNKLINEDCLKTLSNIPSNSIDFCFADPPYNLSKRYDRWDDSLDIVRYFEWCDTWISELARVLKPSRTCAILNIPLWAVRHFTHMRTILNYQDWIVWEGLSLPVRMIMPAHYSIVCFSKGPARPVPSVTTPNLSPEEIGALTCDKEFYCRRADCVRTRRLLREDDTARITDLWWDIHRLKHNSRRTDHPCQLPPDLMRRIIALFTEQRECVLDPFNGAGTTTLCAEQMRRDFIGIELSPQYHELALRRHEDLRKGTDPFRKTARVPRAKNSRVQRLKKQKYQVSKKTLQLEVKRIAKEIGKLPSRDEVARLSPYPIAYFDDYFVSWGEVCAAARSTGMKEFKHERRAAKQIEQRTLF